MHTFAFLGIELSVYLITAICLVDAWRRGRSWAITMVVAMLFAFAVEYFFVADPSNPDGYRYSADFLIRLGSGEQFVPLWVVCGWSMIMYAAMVTTDALGLPWWSAAAADGLLAMSIDLVLDPVAQHVGYWSWDNPGEFFGVPWDNFLGWLLIVGGLSFFIRLGFRWFPRGSKGWLGDVLVPLIAAAPAMGVLVGMTDLLNVLYAAIGTTLTFILGFSFTIWLLDHRLQSCRTDARIDWVALAVPIYFHAFLFLVAMISGMAEHIPGTFVVLPVFVSISLLSFTWAYFDRVTGQPLGPESDGAEATR